MMAQSGDTVASHTPTGEVSAPPRPAATPRAGTQVLRRMCPMAPDMDVGMMVTSDVAVLTMGSSA